MICFVFFSLAAICNALMDRLFEVYKLNVIDNKDDFLNKNWFSYNPLAKERMWNLGILRDGWHFVKFLMLVFLALAVASYTVQYGFLIDLGILVLAWFIPFTIFLKMCRGMITGPSNWKK